LVVSVPFRTSVVFTGAVDTVTPTTISVTGTPFTPGEFNNLFYVRFTSGTKEGQWFTITSNTANTLTVGDTGAAAGDTFAIEAHWTLGTAFPAWLEGTSFIESVGTSPGARRTEVRLIGTVVPGINRTAGGGGIYYFIASGKFWRSTTSAANANNTVLPPQQHLVVRNINTNQTLKVYTLGEVFDDTLATGVRKETVKNDNPMATGRPVPMSLNELGLAGTSAFTSSLNGTPLGRRDEVRLFSTAPGFLNRTAGGGGIYFHRADLGYWVSTTASTTDVSTNKLIQPGQGFVIRRYEGTAGTDVWAHNPPY
jgi:uncharacterized protein (TIGR02597 family)